jgi:hypothetical protein
MTVAEIAALLAVDTGQSAGWIERVLLDDTHAVLGIADRLVYLRAPRVQWNPADHLCVAGQVLCREAPGDRWTLSGEIHAVEQQHQA